MRTGPLLWNISLMPWWDCWARWCPGGDYGDAVIWIGRLWIAVYWVRRGDLRVKEMPS